MLALGQGVEWGEEQGCFRGLAEVRAQLLLLRALLGLESNVTELHSCAALHMLLLRLREILRQGQLHSPSGRRPPAPTFAWLARHPVASIAHRP